MILYDQLIGWWKSCLCFGWTIWSSSQEVCWCEP